MQPKNRPEAIDLIDGAMGEDSQFHQEYGFYVHGVSIETAILPDGWESRTIEVSDPVGTRGCSGHCVEVHDLAASKLAAFREKDRDFVTTLLQEGLVSPLVLKDRVFSLPASDEDRARLGRWLRATVRGLRLAPDSEDF